MWCDVFQIHVLRGNEDSVKMLMNRNGPMVSGALARFPDCVCPDYLKSVMFFVMQIRVISPAPPLFGAPSLVPWAAAPVAYRSIHHCPWNLAWTDSENLRNKHETNDKANNLKCNNIFC